MKARPDHKVKIFAFFLLLLFFSGVQAQKQHSPLDDIRGIPQIIHFEKNDYQSNSQFWCMTEGEDGVLYYGNNDGLLIYNGATWQTIQLPNLSTVRGLIAASDGTIYIGAYNQIGKLNRDEYGKYHYESLNHLLRQEDRSFNDIWQIDEVNGHIVFRSFKMLIAIKGNSVTTIPAEGRFIRSGVINHRYYTADHSGIQRINFKTLEMTPLTASEVYNNEEICALLPGKTKYEILAFSKEGNSYLINLKKGTSKLHKHHLPQETSDQIFCVIKSGSEDYYIGTINNEIFVYRFDKPIEETRRISALQDKTVLNLFETKNGDVWALLNKGLECIQTSAPVTVLFNRAAIFDMAVAHNRLYLATNQGVYQSKLIENKTIYSNSDFRIVDGLEAQAWSLSDFGNNLLVGHDRGIFIITSEGVEYIEKTNGVWKVIPYPEKPGYYLACLYDGLQVIETDSNSSLKVRNRIEDFNISGRDIMPANTSNVFWVCHGYSGVYRIKIDQELKRAISMEHYTDEDGLPSTNNNNVSIWNDEIVFTTTKGIYQFNDDTKEFETHDRLNRILGNDAFIRKILQKDDKTWYINNDEMGYFNHKNETLELHEEIFLIVKGSFIKDMEMINPIGPDKVMAGTIDGLYQFDLSRHFPEAQHQTRIDHVYYRDKTDSIIFCPLSTQKGRIISLPNKTSSLIFEFSAPSFRAMQNVEYSYKLEDLDEQWSQWSTENTREYSHLIRGNYTFKVRARSRLGETSDVASYSFEIEPMWYQTKIAYLVYIISAILIIIAIIWMVRRKIQKTRHEEAERRKVVELELHQIKLEREHERIIRDKAQLEEDVIHKSKELANYTMLLVQKRDLLNELKQELNDIRENLKTEKNRNMIRQLTRRIHQNLQDEAHLKIFDANFERVHQEFFNELKTSYPDLTQKELRLCGFVKMNLTNKEIASILNISVRGVETARYRLRKHLNLEHDTNMVEFLEALAVDAHEHGE